MKSEILRRIEIKNEPENPEDKAKYDRLFDMCKKSIPLTQENVGNGMTIVDRGTFQLIIPSDNTDEHGNFFINSIKGHDCYSYDSKSTHVYRVLDGEGEFIIENKSFFVKTGDVITIQPNTIFAYKGKMLLILEMTPNFKEENNHFVKKVNYDVDIER